MAKRLTYSSARPRVEEVDDDTPVTSGSFGGYLRDVPYSSEKQANKKRFGSTNNYAEVNTTDENVRFHIAGSTVNMSYDEIGDLTQNSFIKSAVFKKISERLSPSARANFAMGVTVVGTAVVVGKFIYDWKNKTPGSWGNTIGTAIKNVITWVRGIGSKIKGWFSKGSTKGTAQGGSSNWVAVKGADGQTYMVPGAAKKGTTQSNKTTQTGSPTAQFVNNMKKLYNTPLTPSAKAQAGALAKIVSKSDFSGASSWLNQ